MPALQLDVALLHANRADSRGDAQYLGPDWYFDDLFAMAADRTFVSCERVVEPGGFVDEGPTRVDPGEPHLHRRCRGGAAAARTSRTACPTTTATRRSNASTPASAKEPDAWAAFRAKYIDIPEPDYRALATASLSGDAGGASPSAAQPESTRQSGTA